MTLRCRGYSGGWIGEERAHRVGGAVVKAMEGAVRTEEARTRRNGGGGRTAEVRVGAGSEKRGGRAYLVGSGSGAEEWRWRPEVERRRARRRRWRKWAA